MKLKQLSLFLILIALFPLSVEARKKKIIASGSTTVTPIIEKAVSRIKEEQGKKLKLKLTPSDSSFGFKDLVEGKTNLCLMSREITQAEYKKFSDLDIQVKHVARDAVVPVVSYPIFTSGLTYLSVKQLVDIYSGKIKNWSKVGGPDATIHIINQKMTSGTYRTFIDGIFQNQPYEPSELSKTGIRSNDDIHTAVLESTGAIAALPMTWASQHVRALGIKRKFKGLFYPSPDIIMADMYPTSRHLSLVTIGEPTKEIQILIDYLLSTKGQKMIQELNFVPLYRHKLR